jgi:hypothetical protein
LPEGKVKIRRGGVERNVREKGRTSDGIDAMMTQVDKLSWQRGLVSDSLLRFSTSKLKLMLMQAANISQNQEEKRTK